MRFVWVFLLILRRKNYSFKVSNIFLTPKYLIKPSLCVSRITNSLIELLGIHNLFTLNNYPSSLLNFPRANCSYFLLRVVKSESFWYKLLKCLKPSTFNSRVERSECLRDKASVIILSLLFLYQITNGKLSINLIRLTLCFLNFICPFNCFNDSWYV